MKFIIFGIFLLFISSQALTCNEIKNAFFIKNNCDADDTCKTVCDDLKNSFKSQGCFCDNTEITYKTQEGGCPVYEESAADCNEGENEADSPCKCTSCGHIEIYMIKKGQFCIDGNWSLTN